MPPQEEQEAIMRIVFAAVVTHALVLGNTQQSWMIAADDQALVGRARQIADALIVELRTVPLPPIT